MGEMRPDRFAQIAELFDAARELPADERSAYVTEQASGDDELIAEVLDLLTHHEDDSQALDVPMTDRLAIADAIDDVPETIGRYRIVRRLGEGGMGVVYLAEQDSPQRTVALKVLKLGFASEDTRRRFEHETNVLGRLQHPGVAQIHDAGITQTPHGRLPYFAMEYVDGEAITDFAVNNRLGTRDRVQLLIDVCHAVQHAHQHGVIHRDLKPANILVGKDRRPRILDFGVARTVDAERHATMATAVGQLVGTLPYMSPEQISGRPDRIDTRCDVYSLGVVAYELLAGRMPHDMRDESMTSAMRLIETADPTPLGTVNRGLRGDLETIVSKALAKEPDRRYESASELAADLQRFLDDQPIQARPASTFYQLSKFARRNKGAAVATCLLALVLIVSAVGGTWLAVWALDERDAAVTAKEEQSRLAREANDARKEERRQRDIADDKADEALANLELAEWREYIAELAAAEAAYRTFDQSAGRRRIGTIDELFRKNWEWRHLAARLLSPVRRIKHAAGEQQLAVPVYNIEVTPDGTRMISGCRDGSIRFLDTVSSSLLKAYVPHEAAVTDMAISRDGALVASCAQDGKIVIFNVAEMTGAAIWMSPDEEGDVMQSRYVAIEFLPDERVIVGRINGVVEVWHWPTLERVHRWRPSRQSIYLDVSSDGKRVAVAARQTVRVFDTTTYEEISKIALPERLTDVAWSPDDALIATSSGRYVRVWNVETGAMHSLMRGVTDAIVGVDFSADGSRVVTASRDGTIRLWHVDTGIFDEVLLGHDLPLKDIAIARDCGWIVSGGDDGLACVSDPTLVAGVGIRLGTAIDAVSCSPADGLVAALGRGGDVILVDPDTTREVHRWTAHDRGRSIDHHASGRWIVTGGDNGAGVWDAFTGAAIAEYTDTRTWAIDTHPSDDRVALGLDGGVVQVRDIVSGTTEAILTVSDSEVRQVLWVEAREDLLACSTRDGRVYVWDVAADEIVLETGVTNGWWVQALASSPDGQVLIGHHGWVAIGWNIDDGTEAFRFGERNAPVSEIRYVPDHSRLVVASSDRSIRMYEPETHDVVLTLRGHHQGIESMTWAAGGDVLVTGDPQELRFWDSRLPSLRFTQLAAREASIAAAVEVLRPRLEQDGFESTYEAIRDDRDLDERTRTSSLRALGLIAREG